MDAPQALHPDEIIRRAQLLSRWAGDKHGLQYRTIPGARWLDLAAPGEASDSLVSSMLSSRIDGLRATLIQPWFVEDLVKTLPAVLSYTRLAHRRLDLVSGIERIEPIHADKPDPRGDFWVVLYTPGEESLRALWSEVVAGQFSTDSGRSWKPLTKISNE